MKRSALLTLLLVYAAMVAANWISEHTFERLPHLEDEIAYLYQARIFERGDATVPLLEPRTAYWQPFVIDCTATLNQKFDIQCEGRRFGKYTPGWSMLLAFGTKNQLPWVVNVYFSGLTIALIYRFGRELFGESAGVIAALLMTISPIALLLNGSLMGHTAAHFFTLLFVYGLWRVEVGRHALRWGMLAGVALGFLIVQRPLTAIGVAAPFILYSILRLAWIGLMPLFSNWRKESTSPLNPLSNQVREGTFKPNWRGDVLHDVRTVGNALWIYFAAMLIGWLALHDFSIVAALAAIPSGVIDVVLDYSLAIIAALVIVLIALLIIALRYQPRRLWATLKPLLALALFTLLYASIFPAFNYATTGDPAMNLYRMVWDYDRVGFGEGYGRNAHTPQKGWKHMQVDTYCYARDLFGWVEQPDNPPDEIAAPNDCLVDRRGVSWVLLIPALLLVRVRRRWLMLLLALALSLIGVQLAYWIGAGVYSARYYFEATGALALVSGAGAAGLAHLIRPLKLDYAVYGLIGILALVSLVGYTPERLDSLRGYGCINRDHLEQIAMLRESPDKPVLVIAHREQNWCKGRPSWRDVGALMAVTDPYQTSDIVVLRDLDGRYFEELVARYPDRQVLVMLRGVIYPADVVEDVE